MKIRAIVTGATGMVGEGVLHECLLDPDVVEVLLVNRRPSGYRHPKIKEIVHGDFFAIESLRENVRGYNACFFCLGVSSVGMNTEDYIKYTYELTIGFARVLAEENPEMSFAYISGKGTDSSESGRIMWARVKGKTENKLYTLGFNKVYNFRPGYMHPTKGLKNTLPMYKYLGWLYPILRRLAKNSTSTLAEMGRAMINAINSNEPQGVKEVRDIKRLAAMGQR